MMIQEDYCTYEISKLLEEKGFDGQTHGNMSEIPCVPYITHQMAMRWLREVHKIDISVTPDDGSWWIKVTELEYWSSVFNGKVLNSDDIKYAYKGDTSTKEGCYEAGLWYVLKNLI